MSEGYLIEDYWCFGCGLVANSKFVCPICSSINYGTIKLDLSKNLQRDLLMELYNKGSLYVHREDGKFALRDRSVGKVSTKRKEVVNGKTKT